MSSDAVTQETHQRAPRQSLINPPQRIASAPFTDHKGNRAISAYYGKSPRPGAPILPSQWSFHYYITFGVTAETASKLPENLVEATRRPVFDVYPFRIDMYFLPGASTEDCMEHYYGEKAARQSAPPPQNFIDPYHDQYGRFKVLVQIESADWEAAGATVAFFESTSRYDDEGEPPSTHIKRNVPWGDLESSGNFVGTSFHNIAGSTGREDMADAYEQRLRAGHSDWA